ncbi:chemotaxis protein CheA [Sulfitobacter sabulilitoris]|uniref:Chemotaxis protein CheA n=1 Tax=Sulfitobacter sabulilitoris TaxID=2562655 RepID=A0A5S3PQ47_9RHOB|nr:chemotaxis protein CheA [Sulfitobacter sabulilitoris]TMM54665.1 chemotaxis protein CheA [Sulfitobacter sabulilitoris]
MSNTPDPMAEIRASFFIECEELLEALQDGLMQLDGGDGDAETINVVFRAVHSIKGGAGAFGLERLVRFAHGLETVLDEVRAGRMHPDSEALKTFFVAADHLSDLVRVSRDDTPLPENQTADLLTQLNRLLGEDAASIDPLDEVEEDIDFQPMGLSLDLDLGLPDIGIDIAPPQPARYTVQFRPAPELFETGNEPFLLLRTLDQMGDCHVACHLDGLPDLGDLNPETPYLGWTIDMTTEADDNEIASVFEFVDGLCSLTITRVDGDAVVLSAPDTAESGDAGNPALPILDPAPFPPLVQDPAAAPTPTDPPQRPDDGPAVDRSPPTGASAVNAPAKPASAAANSVVRVDLDRIERLVNLVGELVINQAMLSQSLETSGLSPHSDAMNGLEEFQRLTRDIQDSVMMIRAQPVKSLFQRMSRIVRESSAAVGKDVRLHTEGDATEVDKTVIERLADPLTHMIRNAVDHGLEPTEMRVAAGKPEQGRVRLTAAHKSGRVVIEVSDDGGGINRSRVLQIATEKGLVAPDASLSDADIDNLLFLPGFSTASVVSDLSGRGVGMDVVRTAIQALGGRISITSVPGEGTTFSISLPLTLAVLDGMVVQVADETLVLPLNVVVETLTLRHGDVEQVHPRLNVVRVREDFVPLFDLGEELGYRAGVKDYEGAVVLLITQDNGANAALVIDKIQDQRQVVIKGLDDSFYRAPGIAAATILGDGQIALILDPSDIIANATGPGGLSVPASINQETPPQITGLSL